MRLGRRMSTADQAHKLPYSNSEDWAPRLRAFSETVRRVDSSKPSSLLARTSNEFNVIAELAADVVGDLA